MEIDFLSIGQMEPYQIYEVSSESRHSSQGSFVICSIANNHIESEIGVAGTIEGAAVKLMASSKVLPHRLQIGQKSANQLRLWQLGYHIPHTVILDFKICDQFKRENAIDLRALYDEVMVPRLGSSVAIRCSSSLEDGEALSYAGTFDTYLDIPNHLDEIQDIIIRSYRKFCLRNDGRESALQYRVRLGIMIQQMVQPKFSGFLFTMDPMNPPNDWLRIEYWQGPRDHSEAYSITLNKESGKRVSSGRENNLAPLPMKSLEELHRAALQLERNFRTPQDVEFLICGDELTLNLVQSRPITAFSFSPNKVRVNEQQRLSDMLEKNQALFHQKPVLSSTNISELFPRAIPLGYSIFKYGFAGTSELDGGISIGRSRLGYAKLAPEDRVNLFYTVADQARTNIIVDALTFRLPGISKRDYLNIFVKYYLQKIENDISAANYPEDGLYLQMDDPIQWAEVAGSRAELFRAKFTKFRDELIQVHAPREFQNAGKFFLQNDQRYRYYLGWDLDGISETKLKQEINDILSYLRTKFCPQYVVFARLAFLCTHLAKVRLSHHLPASSNFNPEQILNKLLSGVKTSADLEGPQYPKFEHLYKLGRITLSELLYNFQHLGPLDIAQPRLGDYSHDTLIKVFGSSDEYLIDNKLSDADATNYLGVDISELELDNDPAFKTLLTHAGQFMRLRERSKSELLKILWILKRRFSELSRLHRFGDLIHYLEFNEVLTLEAENREELRMLALQRKAYLDACQQHHVKEVISNLKSMPFEKEKSRPDNKDVGSLYKFARGNAIFHGPAEGFCLTASSLDEFIVKLAAFKAKNIENIVGVFKGIELSYFNVSALVGFTTQNGGYLSHAATIAREFRLPYITDIGFDQFRDEDYVILDTENDQVIIRR